MNEIKLTKSQSAVLKDFRNAPKRWRTPSGLVEYQFLNHLDGRTVNSLSTRGLIKFKEFGIKIIT